MHKSKHIIFTLAVFCTSIIFAAHPQRRKSRMLMHVAGEQSLIELAVFTDKNGDASEEEVKKCIRELTGIAEQNQLVISGDLNQSHGGQDFLQKKPTITVLINGQRVIASLQEYTHACKQNDQHTIQHKKEQLLHYAQLEWQAHRQKVH